MEFFTHELKNGIRLIFKPILSEVGYAGIFINTGSRDELEKEHGLAHFIEHVIFKGTRKRKAFHILSRLDDVGGELNAYTTKEETCIYAGFLKQDLERSLELISDITFNSVFPEKELEKEKEVILDEINSYKDSPSELIYDDFEDLVFKNHPMGRNILGTKKCLKSFKKTHVETFIKNNYHTDEMVVCVVGDYKFSKLVKYAEKYYGGIAESRREGERLPINVYVPETKIINKDTYQSHIIMGNRAYDMNHDNRLGLHLLNNFLGGPGMNARLSLALREKSGIAYNIESNYSPYSGTGIVSIYLGTDAENIDRSIEIVLRELKRVREVKLGQMQLLKAKRQMKGQITISNENKESLMLSLGKSYLLYGKVDSLDDVYSKIDNISAQDLMNIANETFNADALSYLIYK